jgi:hypothetical protein
MRNNRNQIWEQCLTVSGIILAALHRKSFAGACCSAFPNSVLNQIVSTSRTREITLPILTYFRLATPRQNGYTQFGNTPVSAEKKAVA